MKEIDCHLIGGCVKGNVGEKFGEETFYPLCKDVSLFILMIAVDRAHELKHVDGKSLSEADIILKCELKRSGDCLQRSIHQMSNNNDKRKMKMKMKREGNLFKKVAIGPSLDR